jgi:mycoredoxin
MKKYVIIVAILVIFQNWDDISAFIDPPPDYGAMHDEQVILYATEWCGYCQKARELMAKHNISYFEYDIEKSEEGRRQHNDLGGRGIPVLLINGQVLKGFNPTKILKLVDET